MIRERTWRIGVSIEKGESPCFVIYKLRLHTTLGKSFVILSSLQKAHSHKKVRIFFSSKIREKASSASCFLVCRKHVFSSKLCQKGSESPNHPHCDCHGRISRTRVFIKRSYPWWFFGEGSVSQRRRPRSPLSVARTKNDSSWNQITSVFQDPISKNRGCTVRVTLSKIKRTQT